MLWRLNPPIVLYVSVPHRHSDQRTRDTPYSCGESHVLWRLSDMRQRKMPLDVNRSNLREQRVNMRVSLYHLLCDVTCSAEPSESSFVRHEGFEICTNKKSGYRNISKYVEWRNHLQLSYSAYLYTSHAQRGLVPVNITHRYTRRGCGDSIGLEFQWEFCKFECNSGVCHTEMVDMGSEIVSSLRYWSAKKNVYGRMNGVRTE